MSILSHRLKIYRYCKFGQMRFTIIKQLCGLLKRKYQLSNCKSPGIQKNRNFLAKRFNNVIKLLKLIISNANITHLKPKIIDTYYQWFLYIYISITCLPTIYKVLISCTANKIYNHCNQYNIIWVEQNG